MKRRLQPFYGGSSNIKGLLPCIAETFRTHDWPLLRQYTVPFSSMRYAPEFVNDEEQQQAGGRPMMKPNSISNKDLQLPSFLKDCNISSKGLLPIMVETFRTHDWPLLKYTVPFSLMGNTPEFVDDMEIARWRPLKPISKKDLKLPSFLKKWHISSKLEMLLPSMAEKFESKDRSILQKFNSMDSNLNFEDALNSELAAICVWFLFTKVPPHVKEGVARTLTINSLGTSKVTKMSIDQTGVENLVVCILRSGNSEAQRQVCLALSFLASCPHRRLAVTFGDGIQDQLLQLVCNLSCNPDLTYPVLNAVASVCLVTKGMREKIVNSELLNTLLVKFMSRKDDESIMADACRMVACIASVACERCDCVLWDYVKRTLLPPIVNGLYYTTDNVHLLKGAVYALLKITEYGSSDQINDLVEMGGLKFLFYVCSLEDVKSVRDCFVAIDNILRAGEAEARAKAKANMYEDLVKVEVENEYANLIDDYNWCWNVIFMRTKWGIDEVEAQRLLRKYGPHCDPCRCFGHTYGWRRELLV